MNTELIARLNDLKDPIKRNKISTDKRIKGGICCFVRGIGDALVFSDALREACDGWDHYSGHILYPIRHHTSYCSLDAYILASNITDIDSFYIGEYGRRRLELIDRILDVLEK